MANLSITAGSVVASANAGTAHGVAGTTITAGQALYLDASDGTLKLADADLSSAGATCVGIALNGGASGQPIKYATGGDVTIGATVVVGEIYILSATAGGIADVGDLANPLRTTILGYGKTAAVLTLSILNSDVVRAA